MLRLLLSLRKRKSPISAKKLKQPRAKRHCHRPVLESLERRELLSGDGSLLSSFGTNGLVRTNLGSNDDVHALAIQADGRIVVAGQSGAAASSTTIAVARYTTAGALDTSFAANGFELLPTGGADSRANAIVLQPDGKIVIAGQTGTSSSHDFVIMRLNADGTRDTSFGTNGQTITDMGSDDSINALLLQPDGKIVAVGNGFAMFEMARYLPNGTLDPGFASGGRYVKDVFAGNGLEEGHAAVLLPDGKILAGGGRFDFTLWKFNPNGTPDLSFGRGFTGEIENDIGSFDTILGLAVQPSGKIVAVGAGGGGAAIARFNPDGTPDLTISPTGAIVNFKTFGDEYTGLIQQRDGKLVASGIAHVVTSFGHMLIARFNSDLTFDSSFGVTAPGYTGVSYGTDIFSQGSEALAVAQGPDGNYFLGGSAGFIPLIDDFAVAGLVGTLAQGAPTTTTLSASANTSLFGQSITLTATISSATPGTPTGTVVFNDGQTFLGTGTLSGGVATLTISFLDVGSHSITAIYGGDATYAGSTSPSVPIVVNTAGTNVGLSASPNPATFGQQVTFTATVGVVAPGSGTPTGNIVFSEGQTTLGTVPLSGGSATFATSSLVVGNHDITATYSGDSQFSGSTSAAVTQTVNPAPVSIQVGSSLNPAVVGQSVTLTAMVSGLSGMSPTGSVTFRDGQTTLGNQPLNGGVATLILSSLAVGGHSITAAYSGNANYAAGTSPALTQTVTLAASAATLSASTNAIVSGQTVTFTATVVAIPPGTGVPTGTVAIKSGATIIGTGTLNGGVASVAVSILGVGNHDITAVYSGDSRFATSTSNVVTETVSIAATSIAINNAPNTTVASQPVSLSATVSVLAPGAGTATGSVTFRDGFFVLGTATLNNGTASLQTTALEVGVHSLTAIYSGDSNFAGSATPITVQSVQIAATSTVVSATPNPSIATQAVALTATVTVAAPGTGTPTGFVTFWDGSTPIGFGTLNGGVTTFVTGSLSVATHDIFAVYGGDNNFAASTSPHIAQTVGPALPPTISHFAPTSGPLGTQVVITGTHFTAASAVTFNGVPAASFTVFSDTQIVATAPLTATTGPVRVTVPGGSAAGSTSFTVTPLKTAFATGAAGQFPTGIAVGDFNGDSKIDVATANYGPTGGNSVSVLLGSGDGTLSSSPVTLALPAGTNPFAVATGRFVDGSSNVSIVTGNFSGQSVTVLLGNGNGTFKAPLTIPAKDSANGLHKIVSLTTGDINGDGHQDIVAASGDGTITLIRGNGDGTFAPATVFSAQTPIFGIAVANFNTGTGAKAGLVVAAFAANKVGVLLGNGNGTFAAPIFSDVFGTTDEFLATGDFNHDGKIDVATSNKDSNTLSILLGNGTGTFGQPQTFIVGTTPMGIAAADINKDGNFDVAVASLDAGLVSVFLGKGDGSFTNPQTFGAGPSPLGIAIADFRLGEGAADIVVTNFLGTQHDSVTLAFNDTYAPPIITSISPGSGPIGSQMVIFGANFVNVAAIAFNGIATKNFVVNSPTQITVTVPIGATTGLIGIAAAGGIGVSAIPFTVS